MPKIADGLIARPDSKGDQIVRYVEGLSKSDLPTRQEIADACGSDHGYVSKYLRLMVDTDGVPATQRNKAEALLERRKRAASKPEKASGKGSRGLTPAEAYEAAAADIEAGKDVDAGVLKRANAYARRAKRPTLTVSGVAA